MLAEFTKDLGYKKIIIKFDFLQIIAMKSNSIIQIFYSFLLLITIISCNEKKESTQEANNPQAEKIEKRDVWLDRKNGEFHTLIEDGIGKKVSIVFDISDETIDYILKSKEYEETCEDTLFISKNIERNISNDTLALHLMSWLIITPSFIKHKLKNPSSLQIPLGQKGTIFLTDKKVIAYSYSIQAQNDLGNLFTKQAIIVDTEVYLND